MIRTDLASDPTVKALLNNPYQPPVNGPSEPFWTSGRDGVLKIAACEDCATLIYPYQPMCPHCRSRRVSWRAVSGRGKVVAFTINHQRWQSWMPEPFAIAHVELVEQEGLSLLTNIVGCALDEIAIGMAVEVDFIPRDGYWLPVFAPARQRNE